MFLFRESWIFDRLRVTRVETGVARAEVVLSGVSFEDFTGVCGFIRFFVVVRNNVFSCDKVAVAGYGSPICFNKSRISFRSDIDVNGWLKEKKVGITPHLSFRPGFIQLYSSTSDYE